MQIAFQDLNRHRRLLLRYAWEVIKARSESGGRGGVCPDLRRISSVDVGDHTCGIDNPAGYLVWEAMQFGRFGKRSLHISPVVTQYRWVEGPNPLRQLIRDG